MLIEGVLEKLPSGRWAILCDGEIKCELTSGDLFEVRKKSFSGNFFWEKTRMEVAYSDRKPFYVTTTGLELFPGMFARVDTDSKRFLL